MALQKILFDIDTGTTLFEFHCLLSGDNLVDVDFQPLWIQIFFAGVHIIAIDITIQLFVLEPESSQE